MDCVSVWLIRLLCWTLLFKISEGVPTDIFNVNGTWLRETLVDKFSTIRDRDLNKSPVRKFIVDWFTELSLTVKYDRFLPDQNMYGPGNSRGGVNIIGIFPRRKGNEIDNIYMIGAYYDTRSSTYGNYPLLMNGGGVVGMLEAAKLLIMSGNKSNTLLFVAFDYHFDTYRCCQGSRHFVEKWLPAYFQNRVSNGSIVEFGGAIILESVLNLDATIGIQAMPLGLLFSNMFREVYEGIAQDHNRGDFLLILGRTSDSYLPERYRKMWDFVISSTSTWEDVVDASRLELYLVDMSFPYLIEFLDAIEEETFQSDAFSFYRNRFQAVLITDTGNYRYDYFCDECMVLNEDRIHFLEKTIYTVVYTMETLAYGNYAENIISQIASDESLKDISTTPHDLKKCPTETYNYAEELDLYYKVHNGRYEAVNWRDANTRCENEGSGLLIIHNETVLHYFDNLLIRSYLWVGASDIEEEGMWKWIDGNNVTDDIWKNCQPDDASVGEDCAVLGFQGLKRRAMLDMNCGSIFRFICACQVNTENTTTEYKEECFVNDYEYIQDFDLYYQIYQEDSELATQFDAMNVCRKNNASLFETYSVDDFIWFYIMFSDFKRRDYYINASLEIIDLYQDKNNYPRKEGHECIVLVKEENELSLSFRNCDTKLSYVCGKRCKLDQEDEIKLETWKLFKNSTSRLQPYYYQSVLKEVEPLTFIITTVNAISLVAVRSLVSMEILEEIVTNEPTYSTDFLADKRILFWHRRSSTHIMMATFDLNFPSRPLVKTNDEFTYISVDWINNNVFWSCKDRQIISVTDVSGNKSMVLYMIDLNRPQNIVVDPINGMLFWIESAGIKAASIDRYDNYFKLIIPGDFKQLSIDVFNLVLYVSNDNLLKKYFYPTKKRLSYTGIDSGMECFYTHVSVTTMDVESEYKETRVSVKTMELELNLFLSHIFVIRNNLMIHYFYFAKHHEFEFTSESMFYIQNVLKFNEKVYSLNLLEKRKKQIGTLNACSNNKEKCSHFCLYYRNNQYSCVCPLDGEYLPARNDSCDHSICSVDNGGCQDLCHPQEHYPYRYCDCFDGYILQLNKICINENDTVHMLFYHQDKQIIKAIPNGDFVEIQTLEIPDFVIYEDSGITIDPSDPVLYWIQTIEEKFVVKGNFINGSDSIDVFKSSFEIRSLATDVIGRHLYLSLSGDNSSIDLINMDGFSHATVYKFEENVCFADMIQIDSFNGYIYYTQKCSTSPYVDIIQFNLIENSISVIIEEITYTGFKTSFSLDHKYDIMYWTSGAYQSAIEYRAVHGVESGFLVGEKHTLQHLGILIIGDQMYTTGTRGRLANINLRTKDGIIYQKEIGFPINSITGYSFSYRKGHLKSDTCLTIAKCLGIHLGWTCLSPEDVCDSVENCYNYYDEMHCGVKEKNYKTTKIELHCSLSHAQHEYIYENTTLSFANWDTHSFSKFIDDSQIQNFKCNVFYTVSNLELFQTFKLYSFHEYHRFRQIIISDILRDTNYVQKFYFSGLGISKSWTDQSLVGYEQLLYLSYKHIDMPILENNIFLFLSKLLNLEIRIARLQQIKSKAFNGLLNCQNITLSETKLQVFPDYTFHNLTNLRILDISYNRLKVIKENTFEDLIALRIIDIRGNDFHFIGKIFINNVNLQFIYSSKFSVCCVKPVHMPDENCISPPDYFSSCENLVDNKLLRASMWMFGILAFIGNAASIIYRIKSDKGLSTDTFSILIANLTFSDSLMGVYLIFISSVDQYYRGIYMWNDYVWRTSRLCSAFGILFSVSSEASVFTISYIAFARYLAVKYLFREHRVSRKYAVVASIVFWLISLSMALLPYFSFESYYSSSGVCVSLPLTKGTSAGWLYSFCLFIVFNFIVFLFIAIAQVVIVDTVKKKSLEIGSTGPIKYIEVAKRVTPIIVTDCMCWIPIGVMGIMAIAGYDMPKTVYAWTIVFVVPINSVLNPLLYTFDEYLRKVVRKVFEIVKHFILGYGKYARMFAFVYLVSTMVIFLMFQVFKISEIIEDHQEVYKPRSFQLKRDLIVRLYSINSRLQERVTSLTEVVRKYETEPCNDYLVFGSNKTDVHISVSSSTGDLISNGSLNQLLFKEMGQTGSCAWMASVQDGYQYIQMEFNEDKKINEILLQWGLPSKLNKPCFGDVGSVRVYYSSNCKDWTLVPNGIQELLPADICMSPVCIKQELTGTMIKHIHFESAIKAMCVRFNPVYSVKGVGLWADTVGC